MENLPVKISLTMMQSWVHLFLSDGLIVVPAASQCFLKCTSITSCQYFQLQEQKQKQNSLSLMSSRRWMQASSRDRFLDTAYLLSRAEWEPAMERTRRQWYASLLEPLVRRLAYLYFYGLLATRLLHSLVSAVALGNNGLPVLSLLGYL
jgi:hypothetical protein